MVKVGAKTCRREGAIGGKVTGMLQNGRDSQGPRSVRVDGGEAARVVRILRTTVREEVFCSIKWIEAQARVACRAKESRYSLAVQIRPKKISLAAFLHARKVPGVESSSRICG